MRPGPGLSARSQNPALGTGTAWLEPGIGANTCRCTARARSWVSEPRAVWLEPEASACCCVAGARVCCCVARGWHPGPAPTITWPEPRNRALGQRLLPCSWGRGSAPGSRAGLLEPGASACHRMAGTGDQRLTEAPQPELGISTCCPAAKARGWCPKPRRWSLLRCGWGWVSVPVAGACHCASGARDWSWKPAPAAAQLEPGAGG
ncbi:hypothetical protein G0U57_020669 [Chelydra serpentina]|uniref:Uncharacterized protein n=1 Tax=Chelydra serpentina TaxID=8475 RepID=A0A8T1SUA8_CHESE|nr:hypothetical protein G0U57_020669 [Chelydra serpentina]